MAIAPSQPREPGARGRIAHVAVSFGSVTVAKPKTGRACADPKSCQLRVVVAREIDPPAGAKPVVWRLLTTLPVENAEDALEVIRLYRLRWRIEEVFRVLKRDGLALEETQVQGERRLFNLAALGIIAAARILQLTDARSASARPATDVIDETMIEAVDAIGRTLEGSTVKQKNPHPYGSLSWLSWITARLRAPIPESDAPRPRPRGSRQTCAAPKTRYLLQDPIKTTDDPNVTANSRHARLQAPKGLESRCAQSIKRKSTHLCECRRAELGKGRLRDYVLLLIRPFSLRSFAAVGRAAPRSLTQRPARH